MLLIRELLDEDNVRAMRESGELIVGDEKTPIEARNNPLLLLWSLAQKQQFIIGREGELFDVRKQAAHLYGWGIPCEQAMNDLAEYQPIVEMGAGLGLWALLLRRMGVRVDAYDGFEKGGFGYSSRDTWTEVFRGGPEKLRKYPREWSLLMVWPPYNSHFGTECLVNCNSDFVIDVGEGYGGCTGDSWYHYILKMAFERVRYDYDFPRWDSLHDAMAVYRRTISPDELVEVVNAKWRQEKGGYDEDALERFGFPKEPLERNPDGEARNVAVGRHEL